MADKTMPPVSENLDAPSMDAPMAPPAPDMVPPAPQDGSVMVNIPKAAFDSMHQIVMQLAAGLDQLAQGVNQEAAQSEAPMPPEMPAGPSAPSGDEEFLKGLADEASARTR